VDEGTGTGPGLHLAQGQQRRDGVEPGAQPLVPGGQGRRQLAEQGQRGRMPVLPRQGVRVVQTGGDPGRGGGCLLQGLAQVHERLGAAGGQGRRSEFGEQVVLPGVRGLFAQGAPQQQHRPVRTAVRQGLPRGAAQHGLGPRVAGGRGVQQVLTDQRQRRVAGREGPGGGTVGALPHRLWGQGQHGGPQQGLGEPQMFLVPQQPRGDGLRGGLVGRVRRQVRGPGGLVDGGPGVAEHRHGLRQQRRVRAQSGQPQPGPPYDAAGQGRTEPAQVGGVRLDAVVDGLRAQLAQQQRIAAGQFVAHGGEPLPRRLPPVPPHHRLGPRRGERRQPQRGGGPEPREQVRRPGGRTVGVRCGHGDGQQHGAVVQPVGQVRQKPQGRLVRPLHVVDDQGERRPGGEPQREPVQLADQGVRLGLRRSPGRFQQAPHPFGGSVPGRVLLQQRLEELEADPVGDRALLGAAPRGQDEQPGAARALPYPAEHGGPARSGVSLDEQGPSAPCRHVRQSVADPLRFSFSLHKVGPTTLHTLPRSDRTILDHPVCERTAHRVIRSSVSTRSSPRHNA
jgi:hypothetical protein